jgi:hypothetical protein
VIAFSAPTGFAEGLVGVGDGCAADHRAVLEQRWAQQLRDLVKHLELPVEQQLQRCSRLRADTL